MWPPRQDGYDPPETSPGSPGSLAIWLIALLLALPAYLGTLAWFGFEELARRWGLDGSQHQQAGPRQPGRPVTSTQDHLDFGQAPPLQDLSRTEDFLKALVFVVDAHQASLPASLYLRIKTFERFTETGMDSQLGMTADPAPPNFALAPGRTARPASPSPPGPDSSPSVQPRASDLACFLRFHRNFEPFLPHLAVLKDLGGPQEFVACGDGSIRFPASIAIGDEYEIATRLQPMFSPALGVARVAVGSPYLGIIRSKEPGSPDGSREEDGSALGTAPKGSNPTADPVASLAMTIAPPELPATEKVLRIADYLERTCEYTRFPAASPPGVHPVVDFLTRTRRGHCQYIAAGFVLLCRWHGIPARVAGGFLTEKRDPTGTRAWVIDSQAHAWPEILTNQGWATFDLSVRGTADELKSRSSFPAPSDDDLKKNLATAIRENRGGGKGDPESYDGPEGPGPGAGEAEPRGRPRVRSGQWPKEGKALKPAPPGFVCPDEAKRRAWQEANRRREQLRRDGAFWGWVFDLAFGLLPLALALFLWHSGLWRRALILVLLECLRLLHRLFGRAPAEPMKGREAGAAADRLLAELAKPLPPEFGADDVVLVFNEFLELMGTFAALPREESETPGEYLGRIGRSLPGGASDLETAARTFSTALYGRKPITPDAAKAFCQILRNVLLELRSRQPSR